MNGIVFYSHSSAYNESGQEKKTIFPENIADGLS